MIGQGQRAMIALGANISRDGRSLPVTLRQAVQEIADAGTRVVGLSRFYRTPCFPAGAGPDYVNAAAVVETVLAPEALMARLHAVEAAHGRERVKRWGARTLDLDLIAMGDLVLPDAATQDQWRQLDAAAQQSVAPERLILPHPRMQDRAFVLVPLADVAPDWRHPRLGLSVREMLARLEKADLAEVTPL